MKDLKRIAAQRQQINDTIRQFFAAREFIEVETPIVVSSPGMEPNLSPFKTKVVEPDEQVHAAALITSPEYSMKKLLGSGLEKIFTITKVFRNREELGGTHNPEFSMLEWYAQGEDYHTCMDETEALVKDVAKTFGVEFPVFKRVRVAKLFEEKLGIDLAKQTQVSLKALCEQEGIHTVEDDSESILCIKPRSRSSQKTGTSDNASSSTSTDLSSATGLPNLLMPTSSAHDLSRRLRREKGLGRRFIRLTRNFLSCYHPCEVQVTETR